MQTLSRYEITPDDELVEEIAAILRTVSPCVGREASCYLAGVSAAYLANRLAASGFIVMREGGTRLDV
jgi:hypothetical protein